MQISGNFSVSGVDAARTASKVSNAPVNTQDTATSGIPLPTDQLDLSPEALAIGHSQPTSDGFRADRVADLRQAIAEGNYDTEDKVSKALDKFLDQLG